MAGYTSCGQALGGFFFAFSFFADGQPDDWMVPKLEVTG